VDDSEDLKDNVIETESLLNLQTLKTELQKYVDQDKLFDKAPMLFLKKDQYPSLEELEIDFNFGSTGEGGAYSEAAWMYWVFDKMLLFNKDDKGEPWSIYNQKEAIWSTSRSDSDVMAFVQKNILRATQFYFDAWFPNTSKPRQLSILF